MYIQYYWRWQKAQAREFCIGGQGYLWYHEIKGLAEERLR